jgi:hypothetical protein
VIIVHRSAYFAALLARHAPDASRIAVADFEAPVFVQLLDWVYCGECLPGRSGHARARAGHARAGRPRLAGI